MNSQSTATSPNDRRGGPKAAQRVGDLAKIWLICGQRMCTVFFFSCYSFSWICPHFVFFTSDPPARDFVSRALILLSWACCCSLPRRAPRAHRRRGVMARKRHMRHTSSS
ncbi:hypothetical protein B0H14DRAFT_1326221 [Mycena olivaceomarginata]|nr:hypothetical protein B0H14DRAFT_1326221 [Mycena olivaceomarginata]